jgi:Phytanoyl-CoA dioxygenase (PhyH)
MSTTTMRDDVPVTAREAYFFDLNGFIILRNVLTPEHVAEMNAILDSIKQLQPPLAPGEWYGGVHAHSYGGAEGINLQQIYEAGEPFERLIDHPGWFAKVKHFVGGEGTFDWHHGPLFIDENFANLRGPGEAIGIHSGGFDGVTRCQFRYENGRFHCGQINILMALSDIGPGDGATMVIPASHKSNFTHPDTHAHQMKGGEVRSADGMEGAMEVHLHAGDALLFVDAIAHGSAKRVNPGERRIVVYRYGPSWGNFRHPYQVSPEFLERLTPRQRKVVCPQPPLPRIPNRLG